MSSDRGRTFDPDNQPKPEAKPDAKPDVEGPGAREGEATGSPDRAAPDRTEADTEALGGNDDATRRRTTGDTQGKPTSEGRS